MSTDNIQLDIDDIVKQGVISINVWFYDNGYNTSRYWYFYNDNMRFSIEIDDVTAAHHFKSVWIDNAGINPIESPKFKYNIKISSEKDFYNPGWKSKYATIRTRCCETFGPEYENWHIYYQKNDRFLSFKTKEYLTCYNIMAHGFLQ